MTPERAYYHRLMLLAGLQEEYEQELDLVLETADPIVEPELSLALCMSDLNETLSVLHNYTLDHPADDAQVYDMVLTKVRALYTQGCYSPSQLTCMLHEIAHATGRFFDSPWDAMYDLSYDQELLADGYISPEEFRTVFEACLFHGQRLNALKLQQEQQAKPKRSLKDLFRKRKRKEKSP